jgi:branched-chain amino acid transport system permease protein
MEVVANGLISGCVVALLAAAFAVVYLPTRVFHLALAGVYAAAPYVTWYGIQKGLSLPASVALALTFAIVVSVFCEALNHRPLRRKGASEGAHLVASLGISIILVQMVALLSGNETKVLRPGVDLTIHLAGATLTRTQIAAAIIAAVLLAGYVVWLRVTGLGLRLRALADNPVEVALRGYNIHHLHLLAFGLSGALGSVAALLSAYDLGFDPNGGLVAVLLAIVAMIIGGRQSFFGPIVGGLILGVARNSVVWYWSAKWQEAVTFLLLAICLLFLPNGILGRKTRLEAASA